ncbi:MAG: DegV family protein [Lachnospiraceae bacterium]|nr:DegV family protein [Lachnospiraceae bacterium]
MKDYIIITDASADIDAAFYKEHDIPILPMSYTLGSEMRECRTMESPELLYSFYENQKNGELTQTTQINPFQYEELITPYMEKGVDVLYLALSSGLTSTVDSAMMAAENLKEQFPDTVFRVLDTRAATGGIGILLERAFRNKAAGMSMDENYADLEDCINHLWHWFLVDDLMYLKRGGRIGASSAIVGTMLSIKPLLTIEPDGRLSNFDKVRGTKAAARKLIEFYDQHHTDNDVDPVYICHAAADSTADILEEGVLKITPNVRVTKMLLTPIIGAHVGPGMASIIQVGKAK